MLVVAVEAELQQMVASLEQLLFQPCDQCISATYFQL